MVSEEEFRHLFQSNLQRQISKKGCTQKEISTFVGVSDSIVNQWVHGVKIPRMKNIDKLCKFFMCTRSDLMEKHENSEENSPSEEEKFEELSKFLAENLFKNDPASRAKLKSIKVNGTFSDSGITYPLPAESLALVEDALRVAFKTGELKGRIEVEIDE